MNALRTLLQLGADVNVSKPSGACPLIAAVTNGTTAKVKLLLAAGCNPKVFQHSTGMGCLHLAIAKDDLPVAYMIVNGTREAVTPARAARCTNQTLAQKILEKAEVEWLAEEKKANM
eukprot:18448-Heterococcus_DN1.PRE.1